MADLPDRGIRGPLEDAQDGSSACGAAQGARRGRRTQRAVARELGLSRTTVGKYVGQAAPVRKAEAGPRPRPVWDAVAERVQALLADSVRWTGGKQRLTATRLHELLLAEGQRVGVTVVKDAVAEWKRQRREVFVPLTYRPGRSRRGRLLRGAGRRRRDPPQGVALPDAADVLGPRLRVDLRAAGSNQLSRRARPRVCALRRRAGPRRLRQSAGGRRPDPGRRRAHADAAVRARSPRTTCWKPVSVGPARATIRAASSPAAKPCGSRRSCRFRSARRSRPSTRPCWRRWMRGSTPTRMRPARPSACASPRSSASSDSPRRRSRRRPRRSPRCRRARWCGSRARSTRCRVAGPGLDLVVRIGATTVTIVGTRRDADSASAEALRAAVD